MPTISVVMPAYNAEKTIVQSVNSVLKQSFSDFELLIINDGSTDRTVDLLNDSFQDPRIQAISYENGGLPMARNRGMENASGEFIAFLDSDDMWSSDKLEKQLNALQASDNAGAVYSWTLTMSHDGTQFHPGKSPTHKGNIYPDLLLSNFIASGSNIMIRKEVFQKIGGFDVTLKSSEDWDYYLRIAKEYLFAVVEEPQIFYRQSNNSMSSKIETMERYHFLVHEKAFRNAPPEYKSLETASRANAYRLIAKLCISKKSDRDSAFLGLNKLAAAVKIHPKILMSSDVLKLLSKAFLTLILPSKISNLFLNYLTRFRAVKIY